MPRQSKNCFGPRVKHAFVSTIQHETGETPAEPAPTVVDFREFFFNEKLQIEKDKGESAMSNN